MDAPISQKKEDFRRNLKIFLKIHQILPFFAKINPYKETAHFDDGQVADKKITVYYRSFTTWLIDVALNGLILNFILAAVFVAQPIHPILVLADGLFVWFLLRFLGANSIVEFVRMVRK